MKLYLAEVGGVSAFELDLVEYEVVGFLMGGEEFETFGAFGGNNDGPDSRPSGEGADGALDDLNI